MSDEYRYWILNPAGHRKLWAEQLPEDGAMVDTQFGRAVAIVPPPPDDLDDWICDYCNQPILTRWGLEPFPVPMDGSNAICEDHYEKIQKREGRWPSRFCGCVACIAQATSWRPYLARGYGLIRKEVIAQN